jgi:hypothetical protein
MSMGSCQRELSGVGEVHHTLVVIIEDFNSHQL